MPIDPEYPIDRIHYMIENSNTSILLTDQKNFNVINNIYNVDISINNSIYMQTNTIFPMIDNLSSTDLMYVIYTSGSTGKPKGIMISNQNVVNYIYALKQVIPINKYKHFVSVTTMCFDIFVTEIWGSLLNGLTMVLSNESEQNIGFKLNELCNKYDVDMIQTTPSRFKLLINSTEDLSFFDKISIVMVGGEPLPAELIEFFNKYPNITLFNMYGPTETTVWSSIKPSPDSKHITIGRPIGNTQIYILGANHNLLPFNTPGEICIGGDGLARGYLNNHEMTAKSFISSPFIKNDILYKTGDLGYIKENGEIVHLGRMDSQTKINGFRVELSEIESVILSNKLIKEAVVTYTNNILAAFYITDSNITDATLNHYLNSKLPYYMVPKVFYKLDKMPLTPNGKINKKALPKISLSAIKREKMEPRNSLDNLLIEFLKSTFNISDVNISDSITDLGGDSLTAIKLAVFIQKQLNITVTVKDILANAIIKDLSDLISQKTKQSSPLISPVKKQEYYSVSSAQRRIYYASSLDNDSLLYNIAGGIILDKTLDVNRLEKCFNTIINRHESLRTYFEIVDGDIVQKILDKVDFKLEVENSNSNDFDKLFNDFVKPFNLNKAPLFNAKLINLSNNKSFLLLNMHHIISDGTSLSILMDELCSLYNNSGELPELDITYKDFAVWENNKLNSDEFNKDKEFWVNQFSDEIPLLNMPTNYPRPTVQSFEGDNVFASVDSNLTLKLNELSKQLGLTPYMLLLSIYYILLYKYTGQEDIVVGSPIVGRDNVQLSNIIGMFVNSLALRNKIDSTMSFKDFANEIKNNCLNAFEHQTYPFDELVKALEIKRDTSRSSLFDIMFIYQNDGNANANFDGIKSETYVPKTNIAKYDLSLEIIPENDVLSLRFEYCTKLFNKDFITRLSKHYLNIMQTVINNNEIKIADIDMLSVEEKNQILYDFNNTKSDYPKDKTVIQLFEEQVQKNPDKIAVVFYDKILTYKELDIKVNKLANHLLSYDINKEDIIGIFLDKSLEMIIAILAILKVNACYLPIDIYYPASRINYMLKDSNCKLILSSVNLNNLLDTNVDILNIDFNESFYDTCLDEFDYSSSSSSSDLAYIMYTSGSTGNPKGVMIEQKSIVRLVKNTNYIEFNENDRILQTGSIVFDACTFEIWAALLNGLELYIIKKDDLLNISSFEKFIQDYKITILWLTAPLFNQICEQNPFVFKGVKYVLTGGDVLSPKHINMAKDSNPNLTIINGYGPTENTTFSSCFKIEKKYEHSIPIGKPIAASTCYIVSKSGTLQPVGVPGELWVGGDGLARGYLNNETLTKKSFIDNVFGDNRIYKTGDLVKWLPDGNIEFIGRIDNQVKIRGFRVELNEINAKILGFDNVKESITLILDNNNDKFICSYVVFKSKSNIDQLKKFLKDCLPTYMVPTYIIPLDVLPINTNGKVDKKALPKIDTSFETTEYTEPITKTEQKLAEFWKRLFNIDKIGSNYNFFEIGGDSLLAIRLSSYILDELKTEITVSSIFKYPILTDLAHFIDDCQNTNKALIQKCHNAEYYPVSSAQRRMYYASSLDNDSLLYNIAGGIILDKTLDVNRLEKCFNTIINRHESLRTYFEIVDGDIVQKILDKVDFKLEVENSNSNDFDKLFNDFVKPFNLNKAPLFNAKLINLSNNKSFLLLNMHHIISDGTSLSILMDELCSLYNNSGELPELDITYKDFAVWENNKLNSDEFNKDKEFWVNQFSDEIPLLNMPTNYPRPTVQSFEGDNVFASVDSNLTLKLNELSKQLGLTPYMLLLSIYYILLYKYTGQEDIVVGSPIVGRDNVQLSNIIGMFVNSLALRNKIDSTMSFKDFANEIKNNCLNAFEHQTYPFDELVKALEIKRDTSRSSLFDIMFIYQNDGNANANFDGIKSETYVPKTNIAKYDLSLEIIPENDVLSLRFEYCTKLFNKDFITRLSKHYLNIMQSVMDDNEIKIADIDMLSEEEKHQILSDFNNTKADYPKDKTVIQLFEEQAEKNPDGIAVIFEEQKLTYRELNEKANRLTHYLIDNGIKKNDIISVCMNKNISFIITILGVLKCGCAYLPINPTYPVNRINYINTNSNAKLCITDADYEISSTKALIYDSIDLNKYENTKISIDINNNDLAYVIYTSGSTGNPKGVMVTHNNLVNFLFSFNNCFSNKFGNKDNCLSLTNISFDVSVCEIFTPLAFGATLTLYPENTLTSISLLCEILTKNKITFLYIPPSVLNDVSSYIISNNIKVFVDKLLVGVEAIKNSTLNKFLEINKNMEIVNGYGPTETTICTTFYKYKFSDNLNENVPIGFPISNSKIFILDKDNHISPIGVVGELCVSGDNVSKGYLNNIELTNKSFVHNEKISPTIIYKTGDLAYWTSNGSLSFIGRNDSQIKFRGHRIELNEINTTIRNITDITNSYTMIRKVNNIDSICSFITANKNIDVEYIHDYLKKNLPYYMIPSHIITLDAFPLTLNGKIDLKVLQEYEITTDADLNYVAPENELQKLYCDTWEKLLNTKVGITDDIFELGADSLLAIKFKVEMLSNNIDIEYADIFKYPTVKQLLEANNTMTTSQADSYNYTEIDKILEKNIIKNCKNVLTNKNNNVLLLGSNGFVGMHILYNFIKYDSGKIYCIVRDKNKLSARTRFLDALHFYFDNELDEFIDNRIVIFKGDITKENFGLNTQLYTDIVNNVSIVINSSANVRHYGDFKNFEDINIGLTKKAIEFCEKYNKRLIQISSTSVSGEINTNETVTFSENNLYIGQNLDNVYINSKFKAERIILEHIAKGLNAQILRLGNITNRYSDGKFQINPDENAFIGRIQSLIKLGIVPDYLLNKKLEFTPVDLCGLAIVLVMQNYVPDFSVFHLYNDNSITMQDFVDILKKYDINLKVVNDIEFHKIIKDVLLDDNKKDILSGIVNELNSDNNLEMNSNIKILSEFSKNFLNSIDFNWSKIDNVYIEKYIKYFKNIKFI